MKLRKDGKTTYTVLVDSELHDAIKVAKERGLNLQPLLREYIWKQVTPTIKIT